MTTGLVLALIGYAVAISVAGPRLLGAGERAHGRAPRFGLTLWMITITSWVVAVVSAGLVATAQLTDGHGLAALLRACLRAISILVAPHDAAEAAASVAFLTSALFAGRLVTVGVRHLRRARRHRREHCRELLRAAACWPRHRRITVVDSTEPSAYCVPGPAHTIVVTTGTLRRLSLDEFRAVLAHERSHLRGRHHLWLGWASVLAHAFGVVPLLRVAPVQVARLIEWIADDRAAARHGDRTVARALAAMATAGTPDAKLAASVPAPGRRAAEPAGPSGVALTAAGSGVPERVRRLVGRRADPGRVGGQAYGRGMLTLTIGLLALVTAAATLVPAVTADPRPLCSGAPSLFDPRP